LSGLSHQIKKLFLSSDEKNYRKVEMNMEYIYKEEFSVMGKLGQGKAENPWEWILPIWESANNFGEIEAFAKKEGDSVKELWGIMSSFDESFKRWDENGGKYLACCEVTSDAVPPAGWTKWTVPSQTYLTARCSQQEYGQVFESTINDYIPNHQLKLIGAVHERYPEPDNPNVVELYFPISKGSYFCQSCGMPMNREEDRGTEKNQSKSNDYCVYCYKDGNFTSDTTMDEMIEVCASYAEQDGSYPDVASAKMAMKEYFPTLKRWKKA
jgi:predicted transcriptional regulator YdeE